MPEPHETPPPVQPQAFGELSLRETRAGDEHRIAVAGELDIATAGQVDAALAGAEAGDATAIVLDLSGLTFMDSTGVRLLLIANARCDRLRLRRGPASVQRVFELSGVDDVLPFVD